MGLGLSVSIALHVAILLLAVVGLPLFAPKPPPLTAIVPVDVVRLADITTPPPPARREPPKPEPPKPVPPKVEAPKPAPEPPKPEPPKPEPVKAPEPKPEPKPQPPKPIEVKAPEPKPEPPKPEPPRPEQKVAALPPTPEPTPKPKPKPKEPPPQAKPEPPKPQPEPAKEKPKPEPPKKDEFAALADSLLKDQRKPAPAPAPSPPRDELAAIRSALESSPTQNALTDRPLTISEQDALRRQIEGCWNVPAGAREADDLVVLIRVRLGPNGQVLERAPMADAGRMNRDSFYRAAVESAVRAVDICSPLRLPPEKYALWKDMTLTFNPKDLLN